MRDKEDASLNVGPDLNINVGLGRGLGQIVPANQRGLELELHKENSMSKLINNWR
jgi:hypothetical protein